MQKSRRMLVSSLWAAVQVGLHMAASGAMGKQYLRQCSIMPLGCRLSTTSCAGKKASVS